MGLSFKQKRELQKVVAAKMDELKAGNLSFKEKRVAQKELKDTFEKLSVKIKEKDTGENEKLRELVAGKYNNLKPLEFVGVLKEIVSEIKDVEPIKPPTINYCDANQDKMVKDADAAVMESALRELVNAY